MALYHGGINKALTTKQQKVYSFVQGFIREKGYSPTLAEIASAVGVRAINTAVKHLKALETKGYISRSKHAKRSIEIKNDELVNPTVRVPVRAAVGCDDLSIFANDEFDEFLEVDRKIVGDREPIVAVRAVGDSMNDADIEDGDYVLVQLTDVVKNGELVVAVVGGMVIVKKLERKNGLVILRPESKNPKYNPIILREDFRVAGRVICIIPRESMDLTDVVYDKNSS